jgi:hypothetical protein
MSERALLRDPDPAAEAHETRVTAELNAQHQELRDQAQALLAAVKGQRGIRREDDWQAIFKKAKLDQETGSFIIKRLGAERFLEPELMAALAQLRRELVAGIEQPSAADRMMADSAVIAYYNMLRVQGWIGSLCLTVERELFGQAPLSEIHGATVELCPLEARRCKAITTSVTVGQASQVNVDCAVVNRAVGKRSLGNAEQ